MPRNAGLDALAEQAGLPPPEEGPWLDMMCQVARGLSMPMAISSAEEAAEQSVLFANEAFCNLTGYALEDLEGRNLRILDGRKTEAAAKNKIHNALRKGSGTTVRLTSYNKQMVCAKHFLRIHPVFDGARKHCFTISMQLDAEEHARRIGEFEALAKALPSTTGDYAVSGRRDAALFVALVAFLVCICLASLAGFLGYMPAVGDLVPPTIFLSVCVGAAGALGFVALRSGTPASPPENDDDVAMTTRKRPVQFVRVDSTPVVCRSCPRSEASGSGSDSVSSSAELMRSTAATSATSASSADSTASSLLQTVRLQQPPSTTISDEDIMVLSAKLEASGGAYQRSVDNLDVVKPLGFGSFGEVTLHRDRASGALVVVKKVPLRRETPKQMGMLVAEVIHGVSMHHPCIVQGLGAYCISDSNTLTRSLCMTFQYAAGGSLGDHLTHQRKVVQAPLETEWVIGVLVQLASAVSYMHSCEVIHRDLAADNIFFDDEERRHVMVGDLGLSKKLEHRSQSKISHSVNKAHTTVGTPPYMSPELVAGRGYGKPSDVWGIGVLLFEMLAGARPFDGINMMNTCLLVMEGRPTERAAKGLEESPHPQELRELVSSKRLLCVLAEERTTLREVLAAFELPASFRPLFNMERLPTSRKELELEPGA